MRRVSTILALWIMLIATSRAQTPEILSLKAKLADPSLPIEERARLALQGAATLDLSAQQAVNLADRRAKWGSAVALLDEFVAGNPAIESAPLIQFQAGVYRWAEAQGYIDQFDRKPSDLTSKEGAIRTLDDAIRRFRSVKLKPKEASGVFGQNLHYRLAQAIADRARFDPDRDPGRAAAEREALALLDDSLTTPGLRSFALLLRGQLNIRLGLFGEAQRDLQTAEKLDPPPSPEILVEAKVIAFCGRRQFDEANSAIDSAKVGDLLKNALRLKVLFARRLEKSAGRERRELDDKAFAIAERLRGSSRPEARGALMDLARTIDEPGDSASPDWWDLLAEGHLRLGNTVRAGRLDAKGADRAEGSGSPEKAATLRYKAAAYLFEAGKFAEADQQLNLVVASKASSNDLKARAGMLRSLARGRAVATQESGASRDGYVASLEAQVRDFPRDPNSGEARWLLGQIRQSAGKLDEALELWSGISHGHARWLDARLLIGDRQRESVEVQRINRDYASINAKMDLARKSLQNAIGEASDGSELAALRLQLVRLELIPETGKPALAIDTADRILKGAATPEQHQAARLYRLVALAEANRGAEAEKAAQAESRVDNPSTLLPVLRLLDRAASETDAELNRKRLGLIALVMTSRIVDHLDQVPANLKDEARLHHVRALLFSGNSTAARKEISAWGGFSGTPDDEFLRELADTYYRLDAFGLAIDAERYRASRLSPGSLPWFDARYGLALAYFRADKTKDARQIIDATAILHPDLGGGELRSRFERLRQKLGAD